MRKIVALLALVFALHVSGKAQNTPLPAEKLQQANDEIKTALVSKLNLSSGAAAQIVVIENDFAARLAALKNLGAVSAKEREVKLNEAHVIRRKDLLAIPLTPRQMEDVVELSEQVRRKHKL